MKLLGATILATLGSPLMGNDGVSAFRCKTSEQVSSVNVGDAYAAYASQSIIIMKNALEGNVAHLTRIVAPAAKFTLFAGDFGIGPRSSGSAAALEYAKQIAPRSYSFSAGSSGPFSMQPCGEIAVEGTLIGEKPAEAVIASFRYRDGLLVEVQSSRVSLITGAF